MHANKNFRARAKDLNYEMNNTRMCRKVTCLGYMYRVSREQGFHHTTSKLQNKYLYSLRFPLSAFSCSGELNFRDVEVPFLICH